jgi:hypothetical protein
MRTRAPRAVIGSIAAVMLVLAACGGAASQSNNQASSDEASSAATSSSEAEPTPGTALNACELVTPADIEAAVGLDAGTVADGDLQQTPTVLDPAENECRYQDDAWGGVIVRLTPTDGANLYDAVLGAYDDAQTLDVGDGALWSPGTNRAFIWQGSVTAMLQIGFMDVDSSEWGTIAEQLVQAAATKL